jgi:hypothetical protein
MTPIQKRFAMFLLGCIPSRIVLSYLIDYVQSHLNESDMWVVLKYFLSFKMIIISIGFLSIYWFGWREKGLETQGQPIWWNSLRPIHGLLYGLAGVLLLTGKELYGVDSSQIIFWDAILGLVSFLLYHYKGGNFTRLHI